MRLPRLKNNEVRLVVHADSDLFSAWLVPSCKSAFPDNGSTKYLTQAQQRMWEKLTGATPFTLRDKALKIWPTSAVDSMNDDRTITITINRKDL